MGGHQLGGRRHEKVPSGERISGSPDDGNEMPRLPLPLLPRSVPEPARVAGGNSSCVSPWSLTATIPSPFALTFAIISRLLSSSPTGRRGPVETPIPEEVRKIPRTKHEACTAGVYGSLFSSSVAPATGLGAGKLDGWAREAWWRGYVGGEGGAARRAWHW